MPFVRYVLVENGPVDMTSFSLHDSCKASCRTGHLDIVQLLYEKFPSHFANDNNCVDMFIEACIKGQTEVASWLRDTLGISQTSFAPRFSGTTILERVCLAGHIQTAKWLFDELGLTLREIDISPVKKWALSSGYIEVVKWLIETFPSLEDDWLPQYLDRCCHTADIASFEWILQKMPAICDADMDISEIFQTLTERNSFEMAQHVLKRLKNGRFLQPAASSKCFGLICRQGNIEFAEWFNSQFSQHDRQQKHHLEFVHEGLASGNLAVCQWIIKTFNIPEPFEVTNREIVSACSKHHVEIVHWISTFPSFQELLPGEKCRAFAAVAGFGVHQMDGLAMRPLCVPG
ncbi:hypothetical protein Pelo_16937 [Pelomyxa schiedti]|nr:hypothetical protein Pelo_16937 [Pelomyxa schiedti]